MLSDIQSLEADHARDSYGFEVLSCTRQAGKAPDSSQTKSFDEVQKFKTISDFLLEQIEPAL